MSLQQGGNKTLQGTAGSLSDVDTVARNPIGLEVPDEAGNVYKYMGGVASVAAGDWCILGPSGAVARCVSTPLAGPVGVAMAAIVANTFGWFQIVGLVSSAGNGQTSANIATGVAADLPLFQTSTAGRVNATPAAGCAIIGAFSAVSTASSNLGPAWISRPVAVGFTLASA